MMPGWNAFPMLRIFFVLVGLALLIAVGGMLWRCVRRAASTRSGGRGFDAWGEAVLRGIAGKKNSHFLTPKVLMRHVDALLERYPHRPEIKLAKAQLLIQLHRDAQGARTYCREVFGATRREDPLFQDALHLHLSTYRPSGRAVCAHQAGAASCATPCAGQDSPRPHRPGGAKVIAFPAHGLPGC
jgi:hypothetical protein